MWYLLGPDNRILDVSPTWGGRAVDFANSGLGVSQLINQNFWYFVEGMETKGYLNALFFFSRETKRELELKYRCDGPDVRRWFTMQISSEAEGLIRVAHNLERTLPGNTVVDLQAHRNAKQCSQCLKYNVGAEWCEGFFRIPSADFDRKWVVCPDCREAANGALMGGVIPFRKDRGAAS